MKCKYCGNEFSPKVMKIHAPACKLEHEKKPKKIEINEAELRAKAKEQGIKNWHNKKVENLLKEVE